MNTKRIWRWWCVCFLLTGVAAWGEAVDLLQRYPTKLTAGDDNGERARPWEFTAADVFRVSRFSLEVGQALRVQVGPADLGIGHCADGAVWAVLIPREAGELSSPATQQAEAIAHVWLRFHPKEIARLFPPATVSAAGATNLVWQMRAIANGKMHSSWQAGGRAVIPEPKDLTVDVDTKNGRRRFFVVDTEAATARYVAAFENRPVRPPPTLTPKLAQGAFDHLWEAFESKYAMFVLRPELDWARSREQYRPKALASKSTYEFAGVCAEMLKPLRDLHVWLTVAGADVPVFNRSRTADANPAAHQSILGELKDAGRSVKWAVTADKIGFLAIYGWNDADVAAQCGQVLEQMRNTRALILDVRLNGGGDEPTAEKFAGRFLEKEFVYAYSQYRNGPGHTNLTEKSPRTVTPKGPWRYNRPVVLLIGQKCMSSNESFIGMMTGDPEVTTMGDHTCGSSGNPTMIQLPLNMTVSVPQWIDYLPDGTPLDERGFQPQVWFKPTPGAFEGKCDDLLTAALERLRQVPLPDEPIAGPAFVSEEEAEAADESRPKVVSVIPANGAESVEPDAELRLRFDRPMDPLSLKLNWKSGGFLHCDFPKYDPEKYEFSIPLQLAPGTLQHVVVNDALGELSQARTNFPSDGFLSADHRLARLFTWRFRTKSATPSPAGAKPPKIVKISPAPGSQVPFRTFLEVQFDQPMKPPGETLPYIVARSVFDKPGLVPRVQYDSASNTFRLPLLLPPKKKPSFTLDGFCSAAGVPSEPVSIEYQVSEEELAPAEREKINAGKQNPKLLEMLKSIREKRAGITSLAERVQMLTCSARGGLFTDLGAKSASFQWQEPGRYHADVSQIMSSCAAFEIGSDGDNWWWHIESAGRNKSKLVVCPAKEMQELNVSICDPFGLTSQTPEEAASELALNYLGQARLGDTDCHIFERWDIETSMPQAVPHGSLTRWWIDAQTGRPVEVRDSSNHYLMRTRFLYDAVNQPLPPKDFAVPKIVGLSPTPPDALDADYTTRFVNVRDGSDGCMSARWGKQGPKGRSSSGLN